MAANKTKTKAERALRLEQVSRMYLQRFTLGEIGQELGVSKQQISYDLKALRKQWLESALRDFDDAKARELAKLDALEEKWWDAYRDSVGVTKETTKEENTFGNKKRTRKVVKATERLGDPRYLAGVQRCIDKRCELLGLNAPTKTELTGKDGKPLHPTGFKLVFEAPPPDAAG